MIIGLRAGSVIQSVDGLLFLLPSPFGGFAFILCLWFWPQGDAGDVVTWDPLTW